MILHYAIAGWGLYFGVTGLTSAAVLRGTAVNGTTGKAASGDDVVLMSLSGRPTEIGRSKTDSSGGFEFTVAAAERPWLVHVIHAGVDYRTLVPADVDSVEVRVYETATALNGVVATRGTQRLQSVGDNLQVIDEVTVHNGSTPPRTLASNRPFEIQLPPEAELVAGKVQVGDEQPVVRNPRASGEKDRYYFPLPLLPGDTRFAVAWRLPWNGEAVIQPVAVSPVTELVVVLPETMKFEPRSPGVFRPLRGKPGVQIFGTTSGKQGRPMAFHISGTGKLPEAERAPQQANVTERPSRPQTASTGQQAAPDSIRWFMLGGFVIVAAAATAGFVAHRRKAAATFSTSDRSTASESSADQDSW